MHASKCAILTSSPKSLRIVIFSRRSRRFENRTNLTYVQPVHREP